MYQSSQFSSEGLKIFLALATRAVPLGMYLDIPSNKTDLNLLG